VTQSEKNASHGNYHGEVDDTADNAKLDRRDEPPFHGVPHSDHPHDPFRNDFGGSSLKFEY
jgi:hypothetical protein